MFTVQSLWTVSPCGSFSISAAAFSTDAFAYSRRRPTLRIVSATSSSSTANLRAESASSDTRSRHAAAACPDHVGSARSGALFARATVSWKLLRTSSRSEAARRRSCGAHEPSLSRVSAVIGHRLSVAALPRTLRPPLRCCLRFGEPSQPWRGSDLPHVSHRC